MLKIIKLFIILLSLGFFVFFHSCSSAPSGARFTEIENKGSVMGIDTPNWVKLYVAKGVSALNNLSDTKINTALWEKKQALTGSLSFHGRTQRARSSG